MTRKLENVLIALLWVALAALALLAAYIIGGAIVWLIQQAIVAVWPTVAERPALAGAAILALIVALGAINELEKKR